MDPIVRHGLVFGVAGVISLSLYAVTVWWWWRPDRRLSRAQKWAQRHVSSYENEWLIPFQEEDVVICRVAAVGGFFSIVFLLEIPLGGQPYAAWLLSFPALFSISCCLSGTRIALPPGTRVARLRELELEDYLPERTRLFMWVAGVVGCLACLLVSVATGEWLVGASGSLMLVGPACVELAGRRLARLPEPAQSAAHLYLQDVFRADHIRWAAFSSALSGAMLCNWLSSAVDDPAWIVWALIGMSYSLLTGLCMFALKTDWKASTHMRSRLWPELRPGQLVSDGEPIPAAGATS